MPDMKSGWVGVLLLALLGALIAAGPAHLPPGTRVGELDGGRLLAPTGQLLLTESAAATIPIPGRPVDLALSPDGKLLAVLHNLGVDFVDTSSQGILRRVLTGPTSYLGLAFSPDGESLYTGELTKGGTHHLLRIPVKAAGAIGRIPLPADSLPAGVAVDNRAAYVCLNRRNSLAIVDLASGRLKKEIAVGVAPVSVVAAAEGGKVFVANWGGARPEPGDATANSAGTPTRVDKAGIASSGSVSVIDIVRGQAVREITVGLHPAGMALRPDGKLLAVANANSDSVSLLDTASDTVVQTLKLEAFPRGHFGSSPTAVTFGTGGRLFIACGTNNSVAVAAPDDKDVYRVSGWMPAGWYPAALAAATRTASSGPPATHNTIYVANTKGAGSRDRKPGRAFVVRDYLGTVSVLRVPEAGELGRLSEAVAESNSPFGPQGESEVRELKQLGIRHVFFIIKENRTYDQVFGDLGRGNGDAALALYGAGVTPNHRALALGSVVLDNFYASGAVSADGHQWLTQAFVVDYLERAFASWPRSYPYAGGDPLAYAASGFLWDHAERHGKTVRIYGEYADPRYRPPKATWADFYQDLKNDPPQLKVEARSDVAPMNRYLDAGYPPFHMGIPDQWRLREFLREFREYQRSGNLPNLVIVMLPADHGSGTRPGFPTPRAMVADNDLALGKMVEAISRSRFWPRSVILVTEDDAQNGTDHVDGHRTIALAAGPHVRRGGEVNSTAWNHVNLVRTIEEILGLPPMNKFDAAAHSMRSLFTAKANTAPFQSVANTIPLDEMNPPLAALRGPARQAALDSLRMNFVEPDDIPEDRLNRILWHTARGWQAPYPGVRHRAH